MNVRERASALRCVYCHDEAGTLETCAGCGARIHLDCRAGLARCPTLGCAETHGSASMTVAEFTAQVERARALTEGRMESEVARVARILRDEDRQRLLSTNARLEEELRRARRQIELMDAEHEALESGTFRIAVVLVLVVAAVVLRAALRFVGWL